ncbi:MAG: hypothetical protein IKP47_08065 [Ruminococcus sp.]|nr:hypothetical protein [Ruminococcus sp.]
MGFFANVKRAMAESAARARAEQEALYQRMKQYYRGYDVFDDGVNSQYVSQLTSRITRNAFIKCLILGGGVTLCIFIGRNALPLVILIALILFFVFLTALVDISELIKILGNNYDAFGAMVTSHRVESHTSTDEDGHTTTTYTYFVSLNGIECRVSGGQYKKAPVGQYLHFVRVKGKYIRQDTFYFYPCDVSEEQYRIGQHYPAEELRLYRPAKGSGALTALCVLMVIGAVASTMYFVAIRRTSDDLTFIFVSAGLVGGAILVAIINKCVGLARGRRELEKKRSRYDGQ